MSSNFGDKHTSTAICVKVCVNGILCRVREARVTPAGPQAVVVGQQTQPRVHALDAGMYVVVSHLVVRAHFGSPSRSFEMSERGFIYL